MSEFLFIAQPFAGASAAACLAMAREVAARRNGVPEGLDVERIASMCAGGANLRSQLASIAAALNGLGLKASFGDAARTPTLFDEVIDAQGVIACQTRTRGVSHWVLLYGKTTEGLYQVADPATGPRLSRKADLHPLLTAQNYRHFLISTATPPRSLTIAGFDGGDCPLARAALKLEDEAFATDSDGGETMRSHARLATSWPKSRYLLVDGRLAGAILLGDKTSPVEGDWGRSTEGVALVVSKEYRGQGYGRLLVSEPARLGYDSIWSLRRPAQGAPPKAQKAKGLPESEKMHFTIRKFRAPTPNIGVDAPTSTP